MDLRTTRCSSNSGWRPGRAKGRQRWRGRWRHHGRGGRLQLPHESVHLGNVTLPLIELRRLSVDSGLQAGHICLVPLLLSFHLPPVLLRLLVDLPIQEGDVLPRVRSTRMSQGFLGIEDHKVEN
ncbi:hypothetical protein PIB30_046508 [Stylosanthes scabra]|uniref:Uncharacterized protein n=1 Tax=Stylosanthes scabra TaxID=79078 RepID=A0ABU6XHD8_9FABA|nr:hypothetical protein [Stylosanthes scabra]